MVDEALGDARLLGHGGHGGGCEAVVRNDVRAARKIALRVRSPSILGVVSGASSIGWGLNPGPNQPPGAGPASLSAHKYAVIQAGFRSRGPPGATFFLVGQGFSSCGGAGSSGRETNSPALRGD